MKYGIYCSYWENEWGDLIQHIEKDKRLGSDILKAACSDFHNQPEKYIHTNQEKAEKNGTILTGGYGPCSEHNTRSPDPTVVSNTFRFYKVYLTKRME